MNSDLQTKMFILIIVFVLSSLVSCTDELEPNYVDPEQIEFDGSTDDRFLFKDIIEKEKWSEERYKKDEF